VGGGNGLGARTGRFVAEVTDDLALSGGCERATGEVLRERCRSGPNDWRNLVVTVSHWVDVE
jgi:hypothetical protein